MKSLIILGSTGSIGTQTLEIVRNNPKDFKVVALTANSNVGLLKKQVEEFKPSVVAVADEAKADELEDALGISIFKGEESLSKVCSLDEGDFVVNSLVGSIGIVPTLAAIKKKKTIGLANKETLVSAGELVMREAKKHGVKMFPIDSEHSAIFQCLQGNERESVKRIILTASGGPFLNYSKKDLENVSVENALSHPTWKMGRKITVDSATMMNKGFEVIEAMHLFGVPVEKIDVVIHPESIIHSMVEFVDHSTIAQLSHPDMRIPIQYALYYPKRVANALRPLQLDTLKTLNFMKPDLEKYPCLALAFDAVRASGTMPAVMNAANDVLVEKFLSGEIRFLEIAERIRKVMGRHKPRRVSSVEDVISAISWARSEAVKVCGKLCR